MEKYIFMGVGVLFGIAISLYIYAIKKERETNRIKNDQEFYSTQKLNDALESAVKEMQMKMRQLNRKLTEEEKNDIIFDYLNNVEQNSDVNIDENRMHKQL